MPDQTQAIALLRAILRDSCTSDDAAGKHLRAAHADGIDALDYCAHRFGLGNALVWQRAAHWAGLTFAEETPSRLPARRVARLEHLGAARSFRQPVLGREVQFIAPGFEQVLSLTSASQALKASVRLVPPEGIESGLATMASAQLIEGAQQGVTRLWPRVSAAQDLGLAARIGFVVLLGALVLVVMAAGLISRPVLVPLAGVLLLAPGLMRLAAALPHRAEPEPRRLTDTELPIYSVLVPLRDEAEMVPMLARAFAALDYPVLWSSYT